MTQQIVVAARPETLCRVIVGSPCACTITTTVPNRDVSTRRRASFASFGAVCYHLFKRGNAKGSRMADAQERKCFEVRAEWDDEAGVWWCSNDELPLTTEGADVRAT